MYLKSDQQLKGVKNRSPKEFKRKESLESIEMLSGTHKGCVSRQQSEKTKSPRVSNAGGSNRRRRRRPAKTKVWSIKRLYMTYSPKKKWGRHKVE